MTIENIANPVLIQEAYEHIKKRRKNRNANADIWHVALHWHKIKPQIIHHLKQGTYQFDLVKTHQLKNKKIIALWTTPDAIVLKAFAIALTQEITKNNQIMRKTPQRQWRPQSSRTRSL